MKNREFKWNNECEMTQIDNQISLLVPDKTDLFCPLDGSSCITNAPFYYTEVVGDCVIRGEISMEKKGIYDGVGFVIYGNERHWAKGCLETVDNGKTAAISVVTNGVSDDAIGPYIQADKILLQVSRKGDNIAVHFSVDNETLELIRISHLPMEKSVFIGLIGQAPLGEGGLRQFENIEIKEVTLESLRAGI